MQTNPIYKTPLGACHQGDSRLLLQSMPAESVDLVFTSPPFALQRQKEYGNETQENYVAWLLEFSAQVKRVLKPTGSFVIDIGGAYQKGRPIRSLHQFRFLLEACDRQQWQLAEEFYWHNPAKLPSPIEWVNKRKLRAKDSVNTVWWLCKADFPKANVSNVLVPYSDRMQKLLQDAASFYTPAKRPSGHDIGKGFDTDNGGAIPSNMLAIPNTESTSNYLRLSKLCNHKGHPARFPEKLPEFFVQFLTNEGDTVLDIFSGSNTTGAVAERLNRKWLSFELDPDYVVNSALRFMGALPDHKITAAIDQLRSSNEPLLLPGYVEPIKTKSAKKTPPVDLVVLPFASSELEEMIKMA